MSDAGGAGRAVLRGARRVVLKIGSRLLAEDTEGRVRALAADIAALHARGLRCVLVSLGAIALGMERLGWRERPRSIPLLQASAAVGQGRLMHNYDRAFASHGLAVGQVLLTHEDLSDRARFLNARRALGALFDHGAVPIINENDTVATAEIKLGDNDQLAALTVNLVEADALLLLTDVAGLLDGQGNVVVEVKDIDAEAAPLAGASRSDGVGSGGMSSKVRAAKIAGRFGVPTVVAPGREPRAPVRVLGGEPLGTLFLPTPRAQAIGSRKHWIAYAQKPSAAVVVDEGARRALVEAKRSLLPSGIREVRGRFGLGEAVSILDAGGAEFARGLAGYASEEVERIRGRKSSEIEELLGWKGCDEVIHRDDLVIL
jgi:glutamate 5-kinase